MERNHREQQAESIPKLEFVNANISNDLRSVVTEKHNEAVDEIARLKQLNDSLRNEVATARHHGARL